ncbi:hypothetical protein BH688_13945 [Kushneria phosphatilytica]|nr:hypothetical protein [Kushneria phosphatilytica]OHV08405.1 hypothetical protein BH688_13945 [Kushneria phosphatilytica]
MPLRYWPPHPNPGGFIQDNGVAQFFQKSYQQRRYRFTLAVAIEHHDELVTPQPGQIVPLANQPGQQIGHMPEHSVTGLVPPGIVDMLEVIEVEQYQRMSALGIKSMVTGYHGQPPLQPQPITQPCQWIGHGQLLSRVGRQFALCNVVRHTL